MFLFLGEWDDVTDEDSSTEIKINELREVIELPSLERCMVQPRILWLVQFEVFIFWILTVTSQFLKILNSEPVIQNILQTRQKEIMSNLCNFTGLSLRPRSSTSFALTHKYMRAL